MVTSNKDEFLNYISEPEKKHLMRQIMDQIESADKYKIQISTNFLDPYEVNLAISILNKVDTLTYTIFGGHEDAERNTILITPSFIPEEDIKKDILTIFEIDNNSRYTHRDVLGALLNLGIERKKVGDIIYNEEFFQIFVKNEISDFIKYNLIRIKNENVILREINSDNILIPSDDYIEKKLILSSMRLDLIISSIIGVSRTKVHNIIKSGDVKVNFKQESKPSITVSEGDVLSIRRFGRAYISKIQGMTKKNKFIVNIKIPK